MMSATNDRSAPLPPGLRPDAQVLAVIPHFACHDWLAGALESLLAQTRPLEGIVVVDDASDDPPVDIVARYPQVTLLHAAENVGPYRLIQQVIDATDHEAILFQDADDWSAPDRLERLLRASAATGAELVGSDYVLIDTHRWSARRVLFPLDANAALQSRPTGHAQQHPAGLVARTLIDRAGGYATGMRFSGDDEFLRRAAHIARVVNVPRPLYHRRHRPESLTTAPATGHGSRARRAVLAEMSERALANAAAVAAGEPPDLTPLRNREPVVLRHLAGPPLTPPSKAAAGGTAPASRRRTSRVAGPPAPNGVQIVVVGAVDSGSDVLACSLAQHPAIAYAGDVGWVGHVGGALRAAATAADPGTVSVPETRPATQLDALALTLTALGRLLAPALDAAIIGGADSTEPPPPDGSAAEGGDDGSPETALQRIARLPLTGARRWVGTAPADRVVLARIVELFPDVHLLHVVRDVDEVAALAGAAPSRDAARTAADWQAGIEVLLDLEQAAGTQVRRVRLTDLRRDPHATLAACLELLGEDFDPAVTRPFTPAQPPVDPSPHPAVDQTLRRLSAALLGPTRRNPALDLLTDPPAGTQTDATPATNAVPAPKVPRAAPATPLRREPPVHPSVPSALELVDRHVPATATVAVVSRGDDALLRFAATGWHLPRTGEGHYAGHHPADANEAIAHVEAARTAGADYLLIPSTSSWWLDHYTAFADHLAGSRVAEDDGHLLHSLTDSPVDDGAAVPAAPSAGAITAPAPRVGANRPRVQVLAWSVSHNPYGRAHLLADVLAGTYDVELVGATFDHFGGGVWPPLTGSPLPLRTFPGGPFPDHLARMEQVAADLDGDVLVVSKPRLPSYGLGILAKLARNRPLVLDVDDRELTFVDATAGMSLPELQTLAGNDALRNPYGGPWTRYCDHLIDHADAVTVSNAALQDVYGGHIIGHARDERIFDPLRWNRAEVRARFGFAPDQRIVLFGGTPRRHKGIVEMAAALRQIGDRRLKLCLIDTAELADLRADLADFADWITTVPYLPMEELPALVAAADLVCVLQDPASPVARFQIPAKVTDALALATPCLTTRVPPLAELASTGALNLLDGPLHEHIQAIFDDHPAALQRAEVGRDVFLERLSYAAVRPKLSAIVEESLARPRSVPAEFRRAVAFQRKLFTGAHAPARATARDPAPVAARSAVPAAYDVVVFWKQNDTGVYGRRHDMLLEQLARSPRVRRIVQFDHPIGVRALDRLGQEPLPSHGRLLQAQTQARLDEAGHPGRKGDPGPDIVRRTFVYEDRAQGDPGRAADPRPPRRGHAAYVADTLAAHGIGDHPTVLWGYPKHADLADLIDELHPDLVVIDVVDDHRTWRDDPADRDVITAHYADVLARADVALTNCAPMLTEMQALSPHVHLVPNGCQWPVHPVEGPPPDVLADLGKPIIGYVGNLSARLDVALLDKVAQARPDWTLVFVGSTHAGREVLALDVHPNVHFAGPRTAEDARRFIDGFDVAIIPHVDDEMTRKMHPLKAFVYAACGVPVVSTAISNLGELDTLVRVADDADGFIAQVDAALAEGRRPLTAAAEQILEENSWTVRMAQIERLIDDAWRRR